MPLLEELGLTPPVRLRAGSVSAPTGGKAEAPPGRPRSRSDAQRPDGVPDVEKARFDNRIARLGPAIDTLYQDLKAKKYGSLVGDFKDVTEQFFNQAYRLEQARDGDPLLANQQLDKAEAARQAVEAARPAENAKAKQAFDIAYAKAKPAIDRLGVSIAAGKFGNPPHPHFISLIDEYRRWKPMMDQGVKDGDYLVANRAVKMLVQAPATQQRGVDALTEEWNKLKAPAEKIRAGVAAFPGVDAKLLGDAIAAAATAIARATSHDECQAALDALAALEKATKGFRTQAAKSLVAGGTKAPKAARARAIAFLKQDPESMQALAAEPGGNELLDSMVGDLGGKAKDADSKAFVRAAVTARFGPKLGDADLTTKYLPRLYKALALVPASHTKDNKMLQEINRKRTKIMPSGDYTDGTGRINLEVPRTGLVDSIVSLGAAMMPNQLGGRKISTFDVLTLHEVGHAVDDNRQFMNGKAGNVTYGGWQTHTVDEVAKVVGDGKGFFKDFATLPRPFLVAYLTAVLQKKKPENEATVTSALGANGPADWKKLAKHAAADCCESIRLKGDSDGLWDSGDSGASKHAIGGSVFQESYANQWVSYALSARAAKISNYQFRADGEWYAEAYAAFFVGKLKPSHPLHALLTADKAADKSAQKAKR